MSGGVTSVALLDVPLLPIASSLPVASSPRPPFPAPPTSLPSCGTHVSCYHGAAHIVQTSMRELRSDLRVRSKQGGVGRRPIQ